MEQFRTRLTYVIVMSAFVLIMASCAPSDERDFKNIAKHLRESLSKVVEIKAKKERSPTKAEGMDIYYLNYEERNKFIISKRDEWRRLSGEFKSYMIEYSESKWADDAHFCLVMMYLSISLGGNDYHIDAVKEIKNFLKKYSTIHIEDWTKKEFKTIPAFEAVFDKKLEMPDRFLKEILNLPESKRIRSLFVRAIIMELLKAGKITEARQELGILREKTEEGKEMFTALQNIIIRYEAQTETRK